MGSEAARETISRSLRNGLVRVGERARRGTEELEGMRETAERDGAEVRTGDDGDPAYTGEPEAGDWRGASIERGEFARVRGRSFEGSSKGDEGMD